MKKKELQRQVDELRQRVEALEARGWYLPYPYNWVWPPIITYTYTSTDSSMSPETTDGK